MTRTRAERRHHMVRLKYKRSRYCNGDQTSSRIGLVYCTPCLCSCWMCGNTRYHHGYGMQELKARKLQHVRRPHVLLQRGAFLDI